MAIGSRSQSAKTYLERKLDAFAGSSKEELIIHSILALRESLPSNVELSVKNCIVGIVGKDTPFCILRGEQLTQYMSALEPRVSAGGVVSSATVVDNMVTDFE
eukprot:Sdes_comp13026_c0_seq1m3043